MIRGESSVNIVVLVRRKTAYEMRISDWSSDVCSSELGFLINGNGKAGQCLARRFGLGPGGLARVLQRIGGLDGPGHRGEIGVARSEVRRVGKACVSTCRSRWSR